MDKKKFVIIDAMSLAYKAYYAFIGRPLSNSKGEPTSAVYGFITQLLKIMEMNRPDHIAVAFDSKEKTFRHDRYEHYKSSRQAMPEDMIPQIQRIKDIINALDIPVYIMPGYEADDIIGTAVKKAEELGFESYAITPDKDYNQLVSENIKIARPGRTTDEVVIVDVERIKDEFGFEPIQMIDYLALVGDSSDDIPGVAGIGPKGAIPLIQAFGSVEGIYENLDKITRPALKQKLIEGREMAFLSKELATIHLNVPFDCDLIKAKLTRPDFAAVKEVFEDLEFRTLYVRLERVFRDCLCMDPDAGTDVSSAVVSASAEERYFDSSKVNYHLITEAKDARELAKKLKKEGRFVFDTETDSLDMYHLHIAGASFSISPKEAYFVAVDPFIEKQDLFSSDLSSRLDINEFIKIFKPLFEDESVKKICQNAKFDFGVLRCYGIEAKGLEFDTMIASYVLDPDQKHGMDDLSEKYLSYTPIPLSSLFGGKKDPRRIFDVDPAQLSDYSCEDADITYRLYNALKPRIDESGLERVMYDIELPLVLVLEDMEREGVRIDEPALRQLGDDLQILMDNYTSKIYNLAGEQFNVNSSLQLQKILYDKLGLASGRKTKKGANSTDARSLEALKGTHEIVDLILDYRTVSKLKSTYADALPKLIEPKTGRVHTSFNQTVVSTGRLSSNNPNLQNIPIRSELGKEIRKAFVPRDKKHLILSADYSQIELRIMASICQDKNLMDAFRNNEDIHRSTAAKVFQVDPKEVTGDMRRRAKEVNFGILYGIGAFGLKTRLGITQTHAKEIIDAYFRTFANVKDFMDTSVKKAREKGYAETLLGRRRYLRNINSSNQTLRQFEERVAINMPIQGTAADMIKLAMIKIHDALLRGKYRTRMVLQVHDELVFDVYKEELNEIKPLIKELMESAMPMDVPIVAETGTGENWLEAH